MKSTKKALFLSMMSMLLCVAMLMGTTFAWFTDTVESGTNRIVAGNLDVDMLYKAGNMTGYKTVNGVATTEDGSTPFFVDKNGGKILWEPGVMVYTYFDVENLGTLALQYNFALRITGKNVLETDGNKHSLDEVIKAVVLEGEIAGDQVKSSVQGKEWESIESFTDAGSLQPNGSKKFTVVLYWAPTANDDLYNVKNGQTTTNVGVWANNNTNALYIDFDIRLTATQLDHETDSFDNTYDKLADLWKLSTVKPDGRWVGITKGESCILDGTLNPYITVVGADGQPGEIIALTEGLEKSVGNGKITVSGNNVTYTNSGAAQEVVIRTNSFETALTVDAPSDTVKHYSYASSVDVLHIASASYHENGTVGRVELHDADGHVEAEDGCEIFCLMNATGAEQTADNKPIVQVNEGAIIHTNDQNKNVASAEIAKEQENVSTKGVANGHFDDCGAGRHSFSQLVVDSEHVYDVCTCCGYTLVKVMDQTGNSIKQTKNTLVEEAGRMVVAENGDKTTPIETYLKDGEAFQTTTNAQGETIVDTSKLPAGNITVTEEQKIEETPVIVTEDENGKPIVIDNTCRHEFEYTDFDHEGDDICLGTCKHCDLQIKTQHDWWVITQLPGQTSYKGVCSKCGCINENKVAIVTDKDGNPINYGKYEDGTDVVDGKYETIPAAFAAIHNGSIKEATIQLIKDQNLEIYNHGQKVNNGETITLDLNGHKLIGYNDHDSNSAIIAVNQGGTLTIKDSTDLNNDGNGKGLMKFTSVKPDGNPVPGYASNCVSLSNGVVNFVSGKVENDTQGAASYVFDLMYGATLNMTGGLAEAASNAIRQWANGGTGNTVNITGGTIKSTQAAALWIQDYGTGSGSLTITDATVDGGLTFGHNGATRDYVITITNCDIIGNVLFSYKYNTTAQLTNNRITGNILECESGCCNYENNTYQAHFIGFYSVYVNANAIDKGEGYFTSSQPAGTDFSVTRDWITEDNQIYVANDYHSTLSKADGYLLDESAYEVHGNTLTIHWSGVDEEIYDSFLTIYVLPPVDFVKVNGEWVKANYKVDYVEVDSGLYDVAETFEVAKSHKEQYEVSHPSYEWICNEATIYELRWASNPNDENPDWKVSSYHLTEDEAKAAKTEFESAYGTGYGANVFLDETYKYAITYYGEFSETAYFNTEAEANAFQAEHGGTVSAND